VFSIEGRNLAWRSMVLEEEGRKRCFLDFGRRKNEHALAF